MKTRLFTIVLMVMLMIGAVYIAGTAIKQEFMYSDDVNDTPHLVSFAEHAKKKEKEYKTQNVSKTSTKNLDTYYQNRAYHGAPPMIPHRLLDEKGIGTSCLQCHKNGGYVDEFAAFAPISPHPEMLNCKQCHLPKKTTAVFRKDNWHKIEVPELHQSALVSSPPVMPHSLNMRKNCKACHAGPSAPQEIRTTHPERINCTQCHVPKKELKHFLRTDTKEKISSTQENKKTNPEEVERISEWIKTNHN